MMIDYERIEAQEALIQSPEDPRISLALGETLFQLERFLHHIKVYPRPLTLDKQITLNLHLLIGQLYL